MNYSFCTTCKAVTACDKLVEATFDTAAGTAKGFDCRKCFNKKRKQLREEKGNGHALPEQRPPADDSEGT